MTKGVARERMRLAPGEVLLYPGVPSPNEPVYRVVRGLVRIQHVDPDGSSLTLRFVRPGQFFGEEALIGVERDYFAEAMTETEVEAIDREELEKGLYPELIASLVSALDESYTRLEHLANKRLKNRIAATLLELAGTDLAEAGEEGPVLRLTHDDLAAAVGSVRETVTKVVGELAREGLIRLGYGKLTLIDQKGLTRLAKSRE